MPERSVLIQPKIQFERDDLSRAQLADGKLAWLYDYWQESRGDDDIPHQDFIDPYLLHEQDLLGNVHLVDVSSADPNDFRFELWGRNATFDRGHDYTGTRLGDVRMTDYAAKIKADYEHVKLTHEPLIQRIYALVDWSRRNYLRVILPFGNDEGDVTRLVVSFAYRAQVRPRR